MRVEESVQGCPAVCAEILTCPWMIKIIIYVNIAFFYRKANILHRWSNILHQLYGNKGAGGPW